MSQEISQVLSNGATLELNSSELDATLSQLASSSSPDKKIKKTTSKALSADQEDISDLKKISVVSNASQSESTQFAPLSQPPTGNRKLSTLQKLINSDDDDMNSYLF